MEVIYSYLMNLPIDILITLILSLYKHNLVVICYMISLYQFLILQENENSMKKTKCSHNNNHEYKFRMV